MFIYNHLIWYDCIPSSILSKMLIILPEHFPEDANAIMPN